MIDRRAMVAAAPSGFAVLAHAALQSRPALAAESPLAPRPPHHPPRATRVIFLCMDGGPSHIDLFDPKPALAKYAGQPLPFNLPTERKTGAAFPSPFKFQKHGASGNVFGVSCVRVVVG